MLQVSFHPFLSQTTNIIRTFLENNFIHVIPDGNSLIPIPTVYIIYANISTSVQHRILRVFFNVIAQLMARAF